MPQGYYPHNQRPLLPRIMQKRAIDPDTGCWVWQGSFFSDGYGQISYKNRPLRVHRAIMELLRDVPGMIDKTNLDLVLHHCDNPKCFNPDHLFMGTPQDNMVDRDQKGRGSRGERHHWAIFTERQVEQIRFRFASGETRQEIAQDLGCAWGTIDAIVQRKGWKHVA